MNQGDRVVFSNKFGNEVRGTVVKRFEQCVVILADDGVRWSILKDTVEWLTMERLTVYRAHSTDYLRSLPKEQRPALS